MITLVGTVVYRTLGCAEGAGQDYARIETTTGIVEAHLSFNTSSAFIPTHAATAAADTVALTGTFTVKFTVAVIKATSGTVWDDIVCSSTGGVFTLHVAKGTAGTWIVGTTLFLGFLLA